MSYVTQITGIVVGSHNDSGVWSEIYKYWKSKKDTCIPCFYMLFFCVFCLISMYIFSCLLSLCSLLYVIVTLESLKHRKPFLIFINPYFMQLVCKLYFSCTVHKEPFDGNITALTKLCEINTQKRYTLGFTFFHIH